MSRTRTQAMRLDQLWYGWSHQTWSGRRGYGVIAASPGWETHLRNGDDFLGPAVAFPHWSDASEPPPSSGFVVLRDIPTVFRRVPMVTDGLDRPGSYAVRLATALDMPLDALDAVRLLNAGVLDEAPPADDARDLDPLTLSTPPATTSHDPDSAQVVLLLGGIMTGIVDHQQVVALVPDEPSGRLLVEAALRRLPRAMRRGWTFSSMEPDGTGAPFDLVCLVDGWVPGGTSSLQADLVVDLLTATTPPSVRADILRWAEQLVTDTAPPWLDGHEPHDVAELGRLLDVTHRARRAGHALSATEIALLTRTPAASRWADGEHAVTAAASTLGTASPSEVSALLDAVDKHAGIRAVLASAARQRLATDKDGSAGVANSEAVLLAVGVDQHEIDLVRVRSLPPTKERYTRKESVRIVRTLAQARGTISERDWAVLGRIAWDPSLRTEHPGLWVETVMRAPVYRGSRLDDGEAERLPAGTVPAALRAVTRSGTDAADAGRRLCRVLPVKRSDRARLLTQLAQTPGEGLSAAFLGALAAPEATPHDRAALLERFWPRFVDEAALPPYLAASLRPVPVRTLAPSRRGWVVLAVVLALVALVAVIVVVR